MGSLIVYAVGSVHTGASVTYYRVGTDTTWSKVEFSIAYSDARGHVSGSIDTRHAKGGLMSVEERFEQACAMVLKVVAPNRESVHETLRVV